MDRTFATSNMTVAPAARMAPLSGVEILRLLDDSLGATISVIDRDLRFRYVTAGFAQAFNLTWQQMMGMSLRDVFPDTEFNKFLPYLQRALAGEPVSYERLGRNRQHENVWRSVSLNPWRDDAAPWLASCIQRWRCISSRPPPKHFAWPTSNCACSHCTTR